MYRVEMRRETNNMDIQQVAAKEIICQGCEDFAFKDIIN